MVQDTKMKHKWTERAVAMVEPSTVAVSSAPEANAAQLCSPQHHATWIVSSVRARTRTRSSLALNSNSARRKNFDTCKRLMHWVCLWASGRIGREFVHRPFWSPSRGHDIRSPSSISRTSGCFFRGAQVIQICKLRKNIQVSLQKHVNN